MELDRLMAKVRAVAGGDAIGAYDHGRIARAVSGRAIENERGLTAAKGDKRLGQKRRSRALTGGAGRGRVNETGAVADDACEKVEPMDAKIPEDKIVYGFEGCPGDPAMVPADFDMNAGDFPDQSRANGLPDIGEMGAQRPF